MISKIAMPLLWGCIRWRLRRLRWYESTILLLPGMAGKTMSPRLLCPPSYGALARYRYVWERKVLIAFCAQIRAAEDVLSLTRILKEAWLFGKLQTVGASEAETRAEAAAVKVAAGLSRLQGSDGVGATESNGEPIGSNGDSIGIKKESEERAES